MERRVLLAIFLAFLTLYLWQAFVMPPPKPGDRPTRRPLAGVRLPEHAVASPASAGRKQARQAAEASRLESDSWATSAEREIQRRERTT